jgi:hypothetical protein
VNFGTQADHKTLYMICCSEINNYKHGDGTKFEVISHIFNVDRIVRLNNGFFKAVEVVDSDGISHFMSWIESSDLSGPASFYSANPSLIICASASGLLLSPPNPSALPFPAPTTGVKWSKAKKGQYLAETASDHSATALR